MQEHLPERPSWDCRKCSLTWPCANAKVDLLREYLLKPGELRVHLSLLRWEAFEDYAASGPNVVPSDLSVRFLDWLK